MHLEKHLRCLAALQGGLEVVDLGLYDSINAFERMDRIEVERPPSANWEGHKLKCMGRLVGSVAESNTKLLFFLVLLAEACAGLGLRLEWQGCADDCAGGEATEGGLNARVAGHAHASRRAHDHCAARPSLPLLVVAPSPQLALAMAHSLQDGDTMMRTTRHALREAVPRQLRRAEYLLRSLERTTTLASAILTATENSIRLLLRRKPIGTIPHLEEREVVAAEEEVWWRIWDAMHLPLELQGDVHAKCWLPLDVCLELSIPLCRGGP